jgi:hypothetical protein
MTKTKTLYPRLCIRLNATLERDIKTLAAMRNISRAQVIRDALVQYFTKK